MSKKTKKKSSGVPAVDVVDLSVDAAPTTAAAMKADSFEKPAASPTPATRDDAASKPGFAAADVALAGPAVALGVSIVLGWAPATWYGIVACLVTVALVFLGTQNVNELRKDWLTRPSLSESWSRVPLTDSTLADLATANKFANSAQVREKGLKIVQYVLKAGAYSALFPKDVGSQLKSLSKTTSIARRFFKFGRWVKHFEDVADEKHGLMRTCLYIRFAANIGADWAEDVCSLERIGFLPKGTLSVEFMLFAEYCQLVLALVEIAVSAVKVRAEQAKTDEQTAPLKQRRKLGLVRLELIKFCSDVGKAIYDCELPFAHEGVFIGCSLFSALVSTHKNMFKVLK